MTTNGHKSSEPQARLCHLRRWPQYPGYGFNLHCEKSKPGQYIGKVDANSPAEAAGLREKDRILEVNHVPVGNENHRQVVQRIKEGVIRNGTTYPEEVILLVVDPETDAYFKNKSIIVTSSDPNVIKIETEQQDETDNDDASLHLHDRDNDQVDDPAYLTPARSSTIENDSPRVQERTPDIRQSELTREYKHVTDFTRPTVIQTSNYDSPVSSRNSNTEYLVVKNRENSQSDSQSISDKDKRNYISPMSSSGSGSGAVLDLGMSAAEYRARLQSQNNRKHDPRHNNQMSMKQKHDLIDRL